MAEYLYTPNTDWFSNNIPTWEKVLYEFKDRKTKALEIGSFEGRSTVWLLENILLHPDSSIICVDPFKPYSEGDKETLDWESIEKHFFHNTAAWIEKVTLWKIESNELAKADFNQFDFIYIDGSHIASQVLTDSILSHLLLKKRGILIFDDYLWGGLIKTPRLPKSAIDSFLECFAEKYEVIALGYQVILRKK